jgi:hypothetical protein
MGKALSESRGEVEDAIVNLEYLASFARKLTSDEGT